jgi:diacylglycerol kinase family enzyme
MRALLIVNPHATATTERRRDLLTHALAGQVALRVERTTHRGHAAELAAGALADRTRLVVVHGGDGTVNEVVNGLLTHGVRPAMPMLAVVPGGSTNVFARAIGIDPDPTDATEQILEGLARGRTRIVSLGQAGDRYFTFNAGLGLDAEVVRSVEEHRASGRPISNSLHIRRAIRQFFAGDRRHPRLSVTVDGVVTDGVYLTLISNVDPWTYAGNRPVRTNPGLPADRGLGLLALRSMRLPTVLRIVRQLVSGRSGPRSPALLRVDGTEQIIVTASSPVGLQVDGDYLGERSEVVFRSVPAALRIVV